MTSDKFPHSWNLKAEMFNTLEQQISFKVTFSLPPKLKLDSMWYMFNIYFFCITLMLAKKKTVKILIIVEKLISGVLFWDIFSLK